MTDASAATTDTFSIPDMLKGSWQLSFRQILILIGAWLVTQGIPIAVTMIAGLVGGLADLAAGKGLHGPGGFLAIVAGTLAFLYFFPGWIKVATKAADAQDARVGEVLCPLDLVLNMAGLMILAMLAVSIGCIFLVLPGIFLAVKLQLSPYFVVDMGVGPIEAMKKSWAATTGVFWKLLLFDVVFGILNWIGSMIIIGSVFTSIAFAVGGALIYRQRLGQSP